MKRLARSLVLDDSRADDVVQQVWLTALESKPKDDRDLRPWLKAVARNIAFNLGRAEVRRSRREKANAKVEALCERAFEGSDELRVVLLAMIQELSEPYRSTLKLHYFEGLTLEEIARRLRIPSATVRTRLRRALEQLRSRLDARFGGREIWGILLFPIWKGLGESVSPAAAGSAWKGLAAGTGKLLGAKAMWVAASVLAATPLVVLTGLSTSAESSEGPRTVWVDSSGPPPSAGQSAAFEGSGSARASSAQTGETSAASAGEGKKISAVRRGEEGLVAIPAEMTVEPQALEPTLKHPDGELLPVENLKKGGVKFPGGPKKNPKK